MEKGMMCAVGPVIFRNSKPGPVCLDNSVAGFFWFAFFWGFFCP